MKVDFFKRKIVMKAALFLTKYRNESITFLKYFNQFIVKENL
jgi:hypothetical protein